LLELFEATVFFAVIIDRSSGLAFHAMRIVVKLD